MATARITAALCALAISGAAHGFGTGWGDVFPPLSPEDVTALGDAADVADKAYEEGEDATVSWENDRTGAHGTVQALSLFESQGRKCRNYRLFIKAPGHEPFQVEPVMCLSDGRWMFAAGTL